MARRRSVVLPVLLLMCLAITGCSAAVHLTGGRVRGGPLEPQAGGGATLSPPVPKGERLATSTFGTVLCAADADTEITIDEVRYEARPNLARVEHAERASKPAISSAFREVPPDFGEGEDSDNTPIASVAGGPGSLTGKIWTDPTGPLTAQCGDVRNGKRKTPLLELLTVVTAGRAGAFVESTEIDYRVGDKKYTVSVNWQVGVCGRVVPADFGCAR